MAFVIRYNPSINDRIVTVDLFGKPITTTVTSTASVVQEWILTTLHIYRRHRGLLVVGLGVQWLPNFSPGDDSPAVTLQLCVGRRCLIIQLIHLDTAPDLLRQFLGYPNNTFVGIWNRSDAIKLLNSRHELEVRQLLDLRNYAVSMNGESLKRASFETIAREYGYEGLRLEKSISMSQWDEYWLRDDQVCQACVDAHVSFEIGKKMRAWEIQETYEIIYSPY